MGMYAMYIFFKTDIFLRVAVWPGERINKSPKIEQYRKQLRNPDRFSRTVLFMSYQSSLYNL